MFQFLIKEFNHRTVSFRTLILILFSTLFIIGMLSIIFITHFSLAESMQTVAFNLAKEKLKDIVDGIYDEIDTATAEVKLCHLSFGS